MISFKASFTSLIALAFIHCAPTTDLANGSANTGADPSAQAANNAQIALAIQADPGNELITATAAQLDSSPSLLDRVFTLDHHIPVAQGVSLHVVEKFTGRSIVRWPHRAALMITATLVTNAQWNAQVPGLPEYNALERAAKQGFFAFSATYEGYPGSSLPTDGASVTAERLLVQHARLVEWIRLTHFVPRVDLFGSSVGSSIAVALGGLSNPIDYTHVGKLVLTAHIYKSVTPGFAAALDFLRPALEGAPNGYFATFPEFYAPVLSAATPEAAAWAYTAFPATYAVGPTLEAYDLPVFDGPQGRAPSVVFWGDQDPIVPRADADLFQAEYGGPTRLVVLQGGAHAPYLESVRERFWTETFSFLNGS